MSPTTCHQRNRGGNAERDPNGTKNTASRKIATRDLQENGPEAQPSYGRDVPSKSQRFLGEIITSKKLRKRTTKQSDQYVPFTQDRVGKTD
jgi:hypothetical protein